MLSCEFCEIFKKPFFIENLRWLFLLRRSVVLANTVQLKRVNANVLTQIL